YPCLVHGFPASGYERMPPVEVAPLVDQAIAACFRQPVHSAHDLGGQENAIRDFGLAVYVIRTLAGAGIEQSAGDGGEVNLFGVFVFELVQATAPATVAQAFP